MSALPKQRASKAFVTLVAAVALLIITLALPAAAQTNYFTDWPAGTSPAEVGKRVAEHFVISPHADPKHIVYQEVCTWYGALTFAQLSGDKGLSAKLIQRFDPLMTPEGSHLIGKDHWKSIYRLRLILKTQNTSTWASRSPTGNGKIRLPTG